MTTLDKIIPHILPLKPLLVDEEVTDILVNEDGCVWYGKYGKMLPFNMDSTISEKDRINAVTNIVRLNSQEIEPLVTARLEGGHRVTAVFQPNSVNGTIIAIRKFKKERMSCPELVKRKMFPPHVLNLMVAAIEQRHNILISGGTGCGKTTLLNALAAYIPEEERIIIIEDTAEISISNRHVVHLEATRALPNRKEVTIRDLVKHTLRLQPGRIILGEVRDGAAFDLLQAMNTGHKGTISTIHADSAKESLFRLHTCVAMSGESLPYHVIAENIGRAIRLMVHITKDENGLRYVDEIVWNKGYETDHYGFQQMYKKGELQ